MRRLPIRRLSLLLALLSPCLAAGEAAAFGDCGGSGYFANLDRRYGGTAADCVEAEVFTIETPEGPREVRIVHEAGYPASDIGAVMAEARRGVEAAERALLSIGEGTIQPLTLFASSMLPAAGTPADDEETEGAAVTAPDGCRLIVYPGIAGRGELAYLIAHEFFHCVQYATQGRVKTMSGGNAWWVEGSAEWFAALAFPGSGASDGYVASFDARSPDTPLTSMDYDSVVFFFWLSQTFGSTMVMALMDVMPERAGAPAQQAALLGLLSDEDLLRFAEAYLDRRIRRPGGGAIASNPFPGNIYVWSDRHAHALLANPFVLARAQLEFACGSWGTQRNVEEGRWRVRREEEEAWTELPEHLDVPGPEPETWRLAAFGAEPAGFQLHLEARRDPCRGCENGPAVDEETRRCLVGSWELESGGYGQQIEDRLREVEGLAEVEYPELDKLLVIAADGSFVYPPVPLDHTLVAEDEDGDRYRLEGQLTMTSGGFWSVEEDEIVLCEFPHEVTIDDILVDPDGRVESITMSGGPGGGMLERRRRFECAGSTLTLVEDIPMTPTVTWSYRRQ